MTQEIKKMNIYQKVHAVMGKVKYIQKGDKKVNGQYRFVSHDQVIAACREPMLEFGVYAEPRVVDCVQNGNRTEITMDTDFVNIDLPEDRFTVRTVGQGIDNGDKGPGKAQSYAYKYAFLKAFGLETGEDSDMSADVEHKPNIDTKATKAQVQELENEINGDAKYRKNIMDWLKVQHQLTSFDNMPLAVYNQIMAIINQKKIVEERARQKEASKIQELAF